MSISKRTFPELSFEEKLNIISDYLNSIKQTDSHEMLTERMEWLRRHIPACPGKDDDNYVFISYSHKDFKPVYSDLAFFSYNNKKNVRFWYDEGLPAGDDWFTVASRHLSSPNCVGVIFYLSENLLRSSAVLKEIEMVKQLNKPYFTIALDQHKYCAADYLDKEKDSELLDKLSSVFSRNETSVLYGIQSKELFPDAERTVVYDDEYENAFYRIQKIEQAFSVVDEIFSDFVFQEVEDGLSLIEYRGYETTVYIPERIGKRPVVEIHASFDNATEIYIPNTVKRVLPVAIEEEANGFDPENEDSWSMETLCLFKLGGYNSPGTTFGKAKNLTRIDVAKNNPVFYDIDGILYKKDNTLARIPPCHEWDDKYLDGIETIGLGAFYGYDNHQAQITIPESVTVLEENAFAYSNIFYLSVNSGVKTIGNSAFSHCSMMNGGLPLHLPETVEKLGDFVFRNCNVAFIFVDGTHLEEIPRGAFFGFKGDYISIPDNVKLIHAGAFILCSELETIKLPKGLLGIDDDAFFQCEKLHHITIPKSIRYLSPDCFEVTNILKYIFYSGSSRDFYYLRRLNDIDNSKFISLFIPNDHWFKKLYAHISISVRNNAIKLLKKLYQPRVSGKDWDNWEKKHSFSTVTMPAVISFIFSALLFFVMDYRRLVMQIPTDWIYWLLATINFVFSYSGSKHLYWSYVVNKHKKEDKKNSNKPKSDYLDAWTSVAAIGIAIFGILSLIVTLLVHLLFRIPLVTG